MVGKPIEELDQSEHVIDVTESLGDIHFIFCFVRYDDYDVPDTMNVHGIYDTKAGMVTFESRSEFQSHLQQEAGVSGSYFGFYAGVKSAWGESSSGSSQQYMAQLSVDINR